jgi:uncharacterized protein
MQNHEKILLMLSKAHEKLETSKILLQSRSFDDSVSRSYYAVFHAMSAVLISKGLIFSSHSQAIGAFNREFVKTGIFPKVYSEIIQGLFEDRQIGDYEIDTSINEVIAQESIGYAETIVSDIEHYLEKKSKESDDI